MYLLSNEKDIQHILKYHRAKDMVNIIKFFPGLSPIDELAVILDEEDYLKNKDKISHLTSIRNGNPINELCMKSIPTKEINPNYLLINIVYFFYKFIRTFIPFINCTFFFRIFL